MASRVSTRKRSRARRKRYRRKSSQTRREVQNARVVLGNLREAYRTKVRVAMGGPAEVHAEDGAGMTHRRNKEMRGRLGSRILGVSSPHVVAVDVRFRLNAKSGFGLSTAYNLVDDSDRIEEREAWGRRRLAAGCEWAELVEPWKDHRTDWTRRNELESLFLELGIERTGVPA